MALRNVIRRHQLLVYFALAYAVSAIVLIVLGPPSLTSGGHRNYLSLAMFPVLVVCVGIIGVVLTAIVGGRSALTELWHRWWRRSPVLWYTAAFLIPPAAMLLVLNILRFALSPAFAPGFLLFGIPAGLLAGFSEEWGWTGFAYPRLREGLGDLGGAALLGLLWGVWHLPVVDSLGSASPHGPAWPAFFAAFVALVAALRILICWIYRHTENLMLAQLMHASFTGFLAILGATAVAPAQEALWYALDAAVLWLVVLAVVLGGGFRRGRLAIRAARS